VHESGALLLEERDALLLDHGTSLRRKSMNGLSTPFGSPLDVGVARLVVNLYLLVVFASLHQHPLARTVYIIVRIDDTVCVVQVY
jgi:hypothetical protein